MSFSRRQALSVGSCGIDVKSFFLKSRTSPRMIWKEMARLRHEIAEFAPQVVHAHFGTVTALVAAMASSVPLVITFHGSDLNPAPGMSSLRSRIGRLFSHLAARRAARVICVSSQLSERVGYLKDRVHVVPCGVDIQRFRPLSIRESRRTLGWDLDEKIVLFNARTDPVGKRLDLAEAAVEVAKKQIPGLRLHVFRGKTPPDEMPVYYSAADGLLMTSDYEGSPMVVKEALACNLPVVSVDVGDVVQRLAGVAPSVVVKRDAAALGAALAEVLRTSGRSNGREVAQGFSEESVAREVVSVYRLANKKERAA